MRDTRLVQVALAGLCLGLCAGAAGACTMSPQPGPSNAGSTAPSVRWRVRKTLSPFPGFVRQEFYLNVGLFPPSAPTTCACGFGYSGAPLSGINPLDMSLVTYDSTTDVQAPYAVFPTMLPNAAATAGFNGNPGGAGLNWIGFASPPGSVPAINGGNAPVLGPNITLQLCIRMDVPIPIDIILKRQIGCVLGAEADPNGFPLPFPQFPHGLDPQADPFGPNDRTLPAPGSLLPLGLGALVAARRRR